jgi:hypothetical protein
MKTTFTFKKAILGVFTILFIMSIAIQVFSSASGRTNRTRKTSTSGCSCHTSGTITGLITPPAGAIRVNQTYTFTLTITTTNGTGDLGVDIATARNRGTLGVVTGSGLKLVTVATGNELTHTAPIAYASPKVISFTYTAPSTPGVDTIFSNVDRGIDNNTSVWAFSPNYVFTVLAATSVENNTVPVSYSLKQNFPNPFNPTTTISFSIPKSEVVRISVYDVTGRVVDELVNDNLTAGNYNTVWDANKFASGVYFYKIQAGDFVEMKKMTLLK